MLKTSTVEHEVESKDTSRTRSSSDMTSTSLNEASTVCSPNSPKRIRVMLSNEDRKRFYSATEYDSGSSTTCSSVGGGRVSRPTKCLRTSMMIERYVDDFLDLNILLEYRSNYGGEMMRKIFYRRIL